MIIFKIHLILLWNVLGKISSINEQKKDIQKDISLLELSLLKIERYFDNKLPISSLIYDLENYLNQIITIDRSWEKKFRLIWLDIEIAYSLALDNGLEEPTGEEKIIAENSILSLKKMAQDKLTNLKIEV